MARGVTHQVGLLSLPDRIYRIPCSPSKPLDSFLDFLAAFFSFGVMTAFFFSSL